MKKFRRVMDLVPMMLLWLVLCAFFWGKIFMGLTDTSPENKIVLFIDARVPLATELAVEMEKEKGETIEMVKVYPFTYAMMGGEALGAADLYIVPQAHADEYTEWFSDVHERTVVYDGVQGAADQYISYEDLPGEMYYLYYGKNSLHLEDGEAERFASLLMKLP